MEQIKTFLREEDELLSVFDARINSWIYEEGVSIISYYATPATEYEERSIILLHETRE